jgi:hypothetical protein
VYDCGNPSAVLDSNINMSSFYCDGDNTKYGGDNCYVTCNENSGYFVETRTLVCNSMGKWIISDLTNRPPATPTAICRLLQGLVTFIFFHSFIVGGFFFW